MAPGVGLSTVENFVFPGSGEVGTLFRGMSIEVILIGAAVVLGAILLVARTLRARGSRRRRMAKAAYFNHDAASQGQGVSRVGSMTPNMHAGPGTGPHTWHAIDQPMAPSFNAMKRVHKSSATHSPVVVPRSVRPPTPTVVTSSRSRAGTLTRNVIPGTGTVPAHSTSMVEPPVISQWPTPLPERQQNGTPPSAVPALPPPPPFNAAP
jgi:hypothetical protein